jgi:hypothetical protein
VATLVAESSAIERTRHRQPPPRVDAQEGISVHVVQLLIPARDQQQQRYPRALYDALAEQLTAAFGGVTAYTRAPATGLWDAGSGETVRDQMIIYEVMVDHIDAAWWATTRRTLEQQFVQQEIVIRAHQIQRL